MNDEPEDDAGRPHGDPPIRLLFPEGENAGVTPAWNEYEESEPLGLHSEIALLRDLLHDAIEKARDATPKDPILAVTRLTAAVARAVQLQRLLDDRQGDGLDALTARVLDELDAEDEAARNADPPW